MREKKKVDIKKRGEKMFSVKYNIYKITHLPSSNIQKNLKDSIVKLQWTQENTKMLISEWTICSSIDMDLIQICNMRVQHIAHNHPISLWA